eukprot:g3843.t1
MALFRTLERRRAGKESPASTADRLCSSRLSRLDLNVDVEIKSPHHGPITWLSVDSAEERYLLTGGADCTVALFDLDGSGEKQPASIGDDAHQPNVRAAAMRRPGAAAAVAATAAAARRRYPKELRELGRTPREPLSRGSNSSYGGHRHSVSVVQWYPVDTGLFVSGGMDGVVKLWDTNTLDVALEFDFKDKVFTAAMSASTGQNHLIAVGSDSPQARLCDIRSGAFAHALTGHSEAVWACAWSPRSEFLLATGSADQTARLWDIRRSGASACLISLDQHQEEEDDEEEEEEDDHGVRGADGGGSEDGSDGDHGRSSSKKRSRGYLKHLKLAPHATRASKFARAHAGPVNSLCFAPDGLHLLTSGTDNRLRLWQAETGRNTMTNYLQTKNKRRRPFGMAVGKPAGRRSETVFFPNDKSGHVLAFPLHTADGRPKGQLRAHFDPVQCCAYRPRTQELVTCGADGLVLIWSAAAPPWTSRASYLPPPLQGGASGTKRRLGQIEDVEDQDMWSSDEDERREERGAAFPGLDVEAAVAAMESSGGRGGGSGSAAGGGSGSGGGGGGGFVPQILMQDRRTRP